MKIDNGTEQIIYICQQNFNNNQMGFIDIVVGVLLVFAAYKGLKNGLFAELASLLSLLLGVYLAIQFSAAVKNLLLGFVKWNPNTVQVIAFMLTFATVVVAVSLLGKILTGIADLAFLGWANTLGGGFFRILKTILILGVVFSIFEKINYHNFLAKKETLDNSLFYNPIQKTAKFIFPSIEKWYDGMKNKDSKTVQEEKN